MLQDTSVPRVPDLEKRDREAARKLARQNIDAMERRQDRGFIVSTVAGCGAMLREYDSLLADDPAYAERAKKFAARVKKPSAARKKATRKRSADRRKE